MESIYYLYVVAFLLRRTFLLLAELNNYLSGEVHRLTEEVSRQREEMSRLREEVSEYRRKESERTNANMLEQLNINQQFQETPQQTNYNFE